MNKLGNQLTAMVLERSYFQSTIGADYILHFFGTNQIVYIR